ncbi:MAG TPA: hypothetical protein VIL09_00210 [Microvirga sp.]|jgi:hypothetical protein
MATFFLGNGTTEPLIRIDVVELPNGGGLTFTITQSGSVVGDLRGFYFNALDKIAGGSLSVSNAVYTYADGKTWTADTTKELSSLTYASGEGGVTNLGGGATMSGALGTSGNGYDFGISIGQDGIGTKGSLVDAGSGSTTAKIADDVRAFTFTVKSADAKNPLTLADISGSDFGVRLTSVGTEGGARTDSLKMTGVSNPTNPAVTINAAEAIEGQPLDFSVKLSYAPYEAITLDLSAVSGTATAGSDFASTSFQYSTDGGLTWKAAGGASGTQVTFAAGQTSLLVRVPTLDDATREGSETMTLKAVAVSGAVGPIASGIGTIVDDAAAPDTTTVTLGDVTAAEGS